MRGREELARATWLRVVLALLVATLSVGVRATPAPAMTVLPLVNPCDLPGADLVCDVAGDVVGGVAGAAGDFVMRGVTVWVTNAAVWVTGKVGDLIDATASPDVTAEWFRGQYRSMLSVAGVLALPMLLLAAIQALIRQDLWVLLRSAFGYLPMAFILAGAAIVGTDLLISITDDLSAMVTASLGERLEQPPRVGRRGVQRRDRGRLRRGGAALRCLPGRDHPGDRSLRALARDGHP